MTGILFDSRDSGGSGKWLVSRESSRDKPIFPDLPECLESNSITCHPLEQSLFLYYYTSVC